MIPPAIPILDKPRQDGRVRVKVCGFREPEGFFAAHEAGVDAVGLNFWPQGKRFVEPGVAAEWVAQLGPELRDRPSVIRIGVFVNPTDQEVLVPWNEGTIHAAQLHGDESPEQCRRLMAAGVPLIKAFGWRGDASLVDALRYDTPYLLADAHAPGVYGGTGQTIDWEGLRAAWLGAPLHHRLVLSGGIHPGNAAQAVNIVLPAMLDVASGVEISPGVKDPALIHALIDAVKPPSSSQS